jgi:hypothetical protein
LSFGSQRRRYEDKVTSILKMDHEAGRRMELFQDRAQWWSLVFAILNLRILLSHVLYLVEIQ